MKKLPKSPTGEQVHPALYDPELRWAMQRSRWASTTRAAFEARIVRPLEDRMLSRWLNQDRFAQRVEAIGLPYRSVEAYLDDKLTLCLAPNELSCAISISRSFPVASEKRLAMNQFIWKGDWDLTRFDFRKGSRYRFIDDIWQHREALVQSTSYRRFMQRIEQGKPFRSHHKGILLNSSGRVMTYLNVYLGYMQDMRAHGFNANQGKDRLGVAIDREGQVVKINRGLHRLAMAQVLGLAEIPVQVRAVHALWWQQATAGKQGQAALASMVEALQTVQAASTPRTPTKG
nr:hypothetical protein [uncultured Halomonas sp.]